MTTCEHCGKKQQNNSLQSNMTKTVWWLLLFANVLLNVAIIDISGTYRFAVFTATWIGGFYLYRIFMNKILERMSKGLE